MGVGGQVLVWLILVFWVFQLDFEMFYFDLEFVYSLDGCLGVCWVVKVDEFCRKQYQYDGMKKIKILVSFFDLDFNKVIFFC